MNADERALYERIQAYEIDAPDAALPFSVRLAREQGWSLAYTQRAIEEYKRFAFLAVVAGHIVTPSEAVDQVWHEHMTYTRSYWDDFCANVLGKQLHHDPTQGGADEQQKYYTLYAMTLDSYRRYFQTAPPADIWETVDERFAVRKHHRDELVVISKSSLRRFAQGAAVTGGSALLIYVAVSFTSGGSAYDLTGANFLQFYITIALIGLIVAILIRSGVVMPNSAPSKTTPQLDAYQTAYLNEGASLAADAVITRLVAGDHLVLDAATDTLSKEKPIPLTAGDYERTVYRLVPASGISARTLYAEASRAADVFDAPLRQAGLLADAGDQFIRRVIPTALLLDILLFGSGKILVGVVRERPVGFLIGLCALTLIVALIGFGRRVHRSLYGDVVLAQLKKEGAPQTIRQELGEFSTLTYSMALFGAGIMVANGYPELRKALHPPASGGDGGAVFGGDGGGGCGVGCGGGCGGCGGG